MRDPSNSWDFSNAAVVHINQEHMKVDRFIQSELADSDMDDSEDSYPRNSAVISDGSVGLDMVCTFRLVRRPCPTLGQIFGCFCRARRHTSG